MKRGRAVVIVDVGSRHWRVRFLQLVAASFAVLMAFLAWLSIFHMQADTGGLAPLWERIFMGGAILALGAAFPLAVVVYGRRYVTRMERNGDLLHICTIQPFGMHRFEVPVREVKIGRYYSPVIVSRGQYVNAPWRTLRINEKRLPFVIDMQAAQINEAELKRINRRSSK
jgi:hypothetical protein